MVVVVVVVVFAVVVSRSSLVGLKSFRILKQFNFHFHFEKKFWVNYAGMAKIKF